MAGNVAEWVADVYRPIVDDEFNDFNYFRGNDYKKFSIGPDGKAKVVGVDDIEYKTLSNGKRVATRLPGEIAVEDITEEDTRYRTQFNQGYNVNFRDGDFLSSRNYDPENRKLERASGSDEETRGMYKSPSYEDANPSTPEFDYDPSENKTTLINDQARVYKGGSWKDRAYWLDPAQRRFYPQDQATDFIGFRCAMSRVGSKTFNMKKSRN
jgi:gliding motility-associated lipoprotein GldJ